ncbi:MAG TPA: PAS domain S-box protein, partial [Nitrolancea sp.]|nr:PAS domain S-box protein [Nitrolancea sp.]
MPTQELSSAQLSPNQSDAWLQHERLNVPSTEQLLLYHGPELFASVVTFSPVGHLVVAIDGRILRANGIFCQLTDFKADSLIGMPLVSIIGPDCRPQTEEMLRRLLERQSASLEWRATFLRPTGRETTLVLNGVIVSEGGKPRYITILARDTATSDQTAAQTADQNDTFRSLVERIPAVTYITTLDDLDGTIYISPQVTALLGYDQEEWLAHPSVWRDVLHPEDREMVLQKVRRGRDDRTGFQLEHRVVSRDGRTFWIRNEAALMPDESGDGTFWHGVMYDITERKNREE